MKKTLLIALLLTSSMTHTLESPKKSTSSSKTSQRNPAIESPTNTYLGIAQQGNPRLFVRFMEKENVNPDALNRLTGETALMTAADKGNLSIISELIKRKANLNLQNGSGFSALMMAAGSGHLDAVKMLLDAGAKINLQSNEGLTALMRAVEEGHTKIVELLLSRNANSSLKDKFGRTALDYAHEYGFSDIEKILKNKLK